QPGGDRHQLLEWVRTQLPDQPVHDFGAGWRDGVALRRLVDRLVTGHPSVTGRPEVTADRPVLNVNEAFRRARDVLHSAGSAARGAVQSTLTVTDVISGCDEDRLAAYVAALREAAERRGEPEHPPETPADMAEPPAAAAGTGLTAPTPAARLDLLVEMRSETGDYFSQRLTPRSPARRSLEDEAPAPVSSSGRPRSNIPVGYQVTGRTVNLWYQPPAAGWLSLSIVSGGQHVEGSPFRVYVERTRKRGYSGRFRQEPEPDSVAEAVVEAVKAKVSEAAVKAAEEEATEAAGKEVEGPAGPEEKEQDETVESSLDEQVQKLSMTQSESEPADERAEKVVEDSVKDSDKISAAEAVEQPLEECSVETAGEPLVAEEKEPEDEAASESVVEAPEVATEVVERAKNIVSETIEKALQQIPLNASQKTVVDAEVAEVIEDVVGSAAEGKGESSEGSTTESPEEIGEPAAKEVRELEEKEEMKEPLTEVIEANQATARTEAVPSPTRRTPPLRLLSTVQEMSVDVLVPTADDVHPDNVTPNSPILEEQKEGEKSENQENNQNEDRKPSTPIEQLSDQPDTLPTPAPHSGDKVSSDPNAEQDPLAEPESPGAAASKDAATTTTIPTGEFPEAAAAVSPRQVSEPKQRSLEQTAAALVAAVVSAAEAALASVDAGGDADQSAQTPNEHNEPNHPDGKPNELAEINASAAEKTEDVEEVVMPDASQVSPEPSDSPDDIPDVQIHDKDSQPEINHISWQERVVVADTFDNAEADEADEEAEELFTPMSPVHEYTPSPPLYRRNTFDELVAVTDVPTLNRKER
ncbi:muscle M-line assembly protein unc-89-like, partial [Amphibalanus amphitrite]|uniref:muscle M-line assembly protein unc-89-like n=1 Tax=Amphibalanus amphitrite TaxID=1232801 RepID=UPI001C90B1E2